MFEGLPPTGIIGVGIVDTSKSPAPDKPILQYFGNPNKGEALYPSWSPDSSQIAFSLTAPGGSPALVIAKVTSGEITELLKGKITGVAWSH